MMRANLQKHRVAQWALTALAGAVLTACGGSDAPTNDLPAGITQVSSTVYPATAAGKGDTAATQDLLTGGIGKTGLGLATAPAYADPANPTAAELRRNALYSNYRGILDGTTAGGYGSLYGPNVTATGTVTTSEGLIPGREYVAVLDDGSGRKRTVIAVQVPDSFNPANPCVVLGASSGSRGVYGAIGTAGEWGLKKGCAVALTDAGKGVGIHDLTDDTVHKVDGTRATRTAAGSLSFFAANITDAARAAYNALFPNRLAIKHVHSQMNPEKDWGSDTLAAGRYAMYVLNERYGADANRVPFTTDNTIVIAGSASNGGAASLRAAEQDTSGLIDGVVASEPVTEMPTASGYGIQFGGAAVAGYGKTLADFTTFGNIYAVTGDGFAYPTLRRYAEELRDRVMRQPDVGKVDLLGEQDEAVYVTYDSARLAMLGVSSQQIVEALRGTNAVNPSGVLELGAERVRLTVKGDFDALADIEAVASHEEREQVVRGYASLAGFAAGNPQGGAGADDLERF